MSTTTATNVQPHITTWNLDPAHATAEFKVRHMMVSNVKGRFSTISGSLQLNEDDITQSSVTAEIAAASLDTREPQRDTHLKSADFFDVEKFPTLSFQSKQVVRSGGGKLNVTGDLTIHGVTRSVVFAVEGLSERTKDPWGNTRTGLEATAKVNRKDFGLVYNAALETGGVLIGDEVSISLEAEFILAK